MTSTLRFCSVRSAALVALVAAAGCGDGALFADETVVLDAGAGGAAGGTGPGPGAGSTAPAGDAEAVPSDAGRSDAATAAPDAAAAPDGPSPSADAAPPGADADPGSPVPDAAPAPPLPDAAPVPDLPVCECFVRVSWCGAGAGEAGLSRDEPCHVPLLPEHADDLLGCRDGQWVVLEACEFGCFAAPPGTPDACNFDPNGPTPDNPGWDPCPERDLLTWGLHPEASDRLRCAGVSADRISQTIGNAAASAGYHARDGNVDGEPYCAAVDLRTRDLNNADIRALLLRLGENGFAAWYRQPGSDGWPADESPHIHAVFAGVPMKDELEGQIDDFLDGLNGLASHGHYGFWEAPQVVLDRIRLLFARHH
jgi:hypothetical protein